MSRLIRARAPDCLHIGCETRHSAVRTATVHSTAKRTPTPEVEGVLHVSACILGWAEVQVDNQRQERKDRGDQRQGVIAAGYDCSGAARPSTCNQNVGESESLTGPVVLARRVLH
jgi:hypothetical protein